MSAITATIPDFDWRPWIVGLGIMLAVPIGKLWELADRGDGRGDMTEEVPTQTVKWNPSHGVHGPSVNTNNQEGSRNITFWNDRIVELGALPDVNHVVIRIMATDMESGTTPGDYSNGFAIVDDFLALAAQQPYPPRLAIEMKTQVFGSNPTSIGNAYKQFPNYWVDNGWVSYNDTEEPWSGSLIMKFEHWNAPANQAYIDLQQAYGARYNDHPLVERWIILGETAGPSVPGVSCNDYTNGLTDVIDQTQAAWPNTVRHVGSNFGCGNNIIENINERARVQLLSVGGPDPSLGLGSDGSTAQQCWRGSLPGCSDNRGYGVYHAEVQEQTLCNRVIRDPKSIWEWYETTLEASSMNWLYLNYLCSNSGGEWAGQQTGTFDWRDPENDVFPSEQWNTAGGIKTYIESINGGVINDACPQAFIDQGYACSAGGT